MTKNHITFSPEQVVTELANFAWCSLVALRTAQQDGRALSPLSIHTFLLHWLTMAYKQKRFARVIASDIEGLLKLGRSRGLAANLLNRLEYLWSSCTEPPPAKAELYHLADAIELLKSQGWVNAVVSDDDWSDDDLTEKYSDTDALLVRKTALVHGFSGEGKLVAPVEFFVTGSLLVCMTVFQTFKLPAVSLLPGRVILQPLQ